MTLTQDDNVHNDSVDVDVDYELPDAPPDDLYDDYYPSDVDQPAYADDAAPTDAASSKPKKRLGLKLSDTAPDELFDAYVTDADTGFDRETSLAELRAATLNAPPLTIDATEKQVGGAVAAILDGRLRRDRNGAYYAATPTGWAEFTRAQAHSTIKSLIGRPDTEDAATRAVIPVTWRKATKDELMQHGDEIDPMVPEAADKWAESSDTVRRVLEDLDGRRTVHLSDGFDTKPLLLNAGGLVVDLSPNVVDEINARPLSRHDLISKSTTPRFDPDAVCPTWEKFVAEIMSEADKESGVIQRRPEMERFLQVAAGLTLVGEVVEQAIFVYHGALGSNGKSVYANALSHVFGTYSATLPKAALMEKRAESHTTDLTVLEGARFGYAKETKRTRWDAEQLKDLASREAYAARRMYENNREITPTHTLHITTNNLPLLPSGDAAVWRRLHIIEFLMRWYNDGDRDSEKSVSVGPVDTNLPAKLEAEAAGILNWIIDGLRLYYSDGGLKVPAAVRASTESARRSASLWAEFLIEHFELSDLDTDTVTVADIWKMWNAYKTNNSQHSTLAPASSKDVQAAFEAEMPGSKFVGREDGKRKVALHFRNVHLTDEGEALRKAMVGNGSGAVVLPLVPSTPASNATNPFSTTTAKDSK